MIKKICFIILFIIFSNYSFCAELSGYPDFVDIPIYRQNSGKTIFDDVMRHSKDEPFGNEYGRSTNVHETVHGINSYLRQKHWTAKNKVNGLYAGDGKGIVLKEPNIKMQHIVPFIPNSLQSYRFKLYFIEQIKDWNDFPTYPMDEWVAYIFGGISAIDDHKNKIITEKSDAVSGCLDFSIYCTALCMAIKQNDNKYWEEYPQFKLTVLFFLKKAEKAFFTGHNIFKFPEQEMLLQNLRTNSDAIEVRKFLLEEFNGVFIK